MTYPICPNGHEQNPGNVQSYTKKNGRTYTFCHPCALNRSKNWHHANKLLWNKKTRSPRLKANRQVKTNGMCQHLRCTKCDDLSIRYSPYYVCCQCYNLHHKENGKVKRYE